MERRRVGDRHHCGRAVVIATGIALGLSWTLGSAPSVGAAEEPQPIPIVTIAAITDGLVVQDGVRPCSEISSLEVQPGQFEVQRSGSTELPLTVQYVSEPSAGGEQDSDPLPGEVTIPAGVATATIAVNLRYPTGPAPLHIHRSSSLTVSLADTATYDVGAASGAAISLRFDIAIFECVAPPATPAATPTGPSGPDPAAPASVAPTAATPTATPAATTPAAATLPFTGAPITALAGAGSGLLAFGALGARYA